MLPSINITEVFDAILQQEKKNWQLISAMLTGSSLQPDFMHSCSDLDIIFIAKSKFSKDFHIALKGLIKIGSIENIIEYTVYSIEAYAEKIRLGDLVIPFALTLGYRLLYGSSDLPTALHCLSVQRFNALFERFIEDNQAISFDHAISKLTSFLSVSIHTLEMERLEQNNILYLTKSTYLLKCIVLNYYKLLLIKQNIRGKEISLAIKTSFFMMNEDRSYRLFDFEKYRIDPSVQELMEHINLYIATKGRILASGELRHIFFNISMPYYNSLLESRPESL